ncbi:MAG: hypothetical protein IT287_02415 [Bdellovibrionaceae bacterium]|nr:hypothetical protein [Pseudobdellovibrionaceae bacterium]
MSTQSFFPTKIYKAPVSTKSNISALNKQLLKEIEILSEEDTAGIAWSNKHYPNGFTSYASANQMNIVSPTFEELELHIKKHVKKYVDNLELNLDVKALRMTTCWVNIMPKGAIHTSHNHPQSIISGTYYVQMPPKSSALRFEDPRYPFYMSRPALRTESKNQVNQSLSAVPGDVILFESWLRHEVPLNNSAQPRVSISFNY